MATLLQPWQVYHVGPNGQRCKRDAPGARQVKERVKCWYGQFRNAVGKWVRVRLSTNRRAAESMLAELTRRVDLERAGLPVPDADGVRSAPWSALVDEWERELTAQGIADGQRGNLLRSVRRVWEGTGARCLDALTTDRVNAWFTGFRAERSTRTWNECVRQCRRFGRWLVERKGAPRSPFAHLREVSVDGDRRIVRGALERDAVDKLLASVLACGEDWRRLDATSRYWLYRVAIQTGYRSRELASIDAGSLVVGCVLVAGTHTKNRKDARQPIPPDTFAGLVAWAGTRGPGILWPGRWWQHGAEMLRRDLTAAGVPLVDREGRQIDFHALRHTYVTWLGRAGVNTREHQTLARHSDPRLTIGTYSHTDAERLAGVAQSVFGSPPVAQDPSTLLNSGVPWYTIGQWERIEANLLQEDGFQ